MDNLREKIAKRLREMDGAAPLLGERGRIGYLQRADDILAIPEIKDALDNMADKLVGHVKGGDALYMKCEPIIQKAGIFDRDWRPNSIGAID